MILHSSFQQFFLQNQRHKQHANDLITVAWVRLRIVVFCIENAVAALSK